MRPMAKVKRGYELDECVVEALDKLIDETRLSKQVAIGVAVALFAGLDKTQRALAIEWYWAWLEGKESGPVLAFSPEPLSDAQGDRVRELIREELSAMVDVSGIEAAAKEAADAGIRGDGIEQKKRG